MCSNDAYSRYPVLLGGKKEGGNKEIQQPSRFKEETPNIN